jgi:hypothetical protein
MTSTATTTMTMATTTTTTTANIPSLAQLATYALVGYSPCHVMSYLSRDCFRGMCKEDVQYELTRRIKAVGRIPWQTSGVITFDCHTEDDGTYTIRFDAGSDNQFWMEVMVTMYALDDFCERPWKTKTLQCRGRVIGRKLDCRLVRYCDDSDSYFFRVDSAYDLSFWMAFTVTAKQFRAVPCGDGNCNDCDQ